MSWQRILRRQIGKKKARRPQKIAYYRVRVQGRGREFATGEQKMGSGGAGSRGRAPVGVPRSRRQMLISSYDGGHALMSPLATPLFGCATVTYRKLPNCRTAVENNRMTNSQRQRLPSPETSYNFRVSSVHIISSLARCCLDSRISRIRGILYAGRVQN